MERHTREALRAMGMTDDSWRALLVLPLVAVAWADGTVQDAERRVVEACATDLGVDADGWLHVQNWLDFRPSDATIRRGQELLVEVVRSQGGGNLLDDVVAFSKAVAKAAGGAFGFGAISAEEAAAIDRLAAALSVPSPRSWVRPEDVTFIPADADHESEGPDLDVLFHTPDDGSAAGVGRLLFLPAFGEERAGRIGSAGLSLGRADDNDVQVLFDAQVSRRHARLTVVGAKVYAEDLGSSTGTWVNGQRVARVRLIGGEELRLGSTRLYVQLHGEATTLP